MLLWKVLADELASRCRTSTTLDCKTVERRVKDEGLSFLTITLPQFGKDFEKSLESGCLDRQDFQGFSWRSGLPKFLSGFLCQIFDTSDGRLLDNPSVDAIHAVRQLTLLVGKLFLVSNRDRERAAMDGYVEIEQDVREFDNIFTEEMRFRFRRVSNLLLGRDLLPIDRKIGRGEYLAPMHGPGATADGLKGNRKWKQNTWPRRLEEFFPMDEYLLPNHSFWELLEGVDILEPEDEIPVKVISVPKTQKTPRIIAMEPTAMLYAQKSLQEVIYESVQRSDTLRTLIGFLDQEPNRVLAERGSSDGSLATLDLSEASDRVSFEHVRELLAFTPNLLGAVDACRSRKAQVDGHGVIPLAKYASMGSALCFPIEAMVFLTLVFIGIEEKLNRHLTRKDVESFTGRVRVFGDDIIVSVDCVEQVIWSLEYFGMKVNRSKSFWTGRFRESCGKEYFAGHDVSIVRVRQLPPASSADAQRVISWVQMSNQFYRAGLWRTVRWLDSFMSGILSDYPVVEESSAVLGRHSFMGYQAQKTGGRYQVPLVRGFVPHGVIPANRLDEHHALHKWFLLRGDLPIADEDHLERSGRPSVVNIKRRWVKPY